MKKEKYYFDDDNKVYKSYKDLMSEEFDSIYSKYRKIKDNHWSMKPEDPETVRLKKLAKERERKINSILS